MGASPRQAIILVTLVAGVLVIPAPASAGGGGCGEVTEGSGTTVEFLYACITPTILRADVGEQITFVNRDEYRHVITAAGYGWMTDGWFRPGDVFSVTFRGDGVYPYQCFLHPGMTGAVVVGTGAGLGPADRGNVVVAPPEPPEAEVLTVTSPPEIRTVTRGSGPSAVLGGVAIGAAVALVVMFGARLALRRRVRLAEP